MIHKEKERERKKKGRDRGKKTETKRKKELDMCKARVAQLVYINKGYNWKENPKKENSYEKSNLLVIWNRRLLKLFLTQRNKGSNGCYYKIIKNVSLTAKLEQWIPAIENLKTFETTFDCNKWCRM